MQTFLVGSFEYTASVLDYLRLGKQRVEAHQILRIIYGQSEGYKNHPAVNMWRGYEHALINYYSAMCREWIGRGYNNTMPILIPYPDCPLPNWSQNESVWLMYRRLLVGKKPEFYSSFWIDVTPIYDCDWSLIDEVTMHSCI